MANESTTFEINVPQETQALSSAPPLSRAGWARIYLDSTLGWLTSINAAAYAPLGTGAGGPPTGAAGGDLAGTYPNPTLAAFGGGATGPIGSASVVPILTVDAKGRVSALTSASIQIAESQVTNLVSDLAAKQGSSSVLTALATVMSSTATAAAQRTALGLGSAALNNTADFDAAGAAAAAQAASQPVNAVLTALTTVMSATATAIAQRAAIGADAYDIGFFAAGAPTASQIVLVFVADRTIVLPINLTGSKGASITAATAQADFDIQVNGVSKGTMRFAASATTASFIFSASVTLSVGDIVKVVAPGSADATLANVAGTFLGTF